MKINIVPAVFFIAIAFFLLFNPINDAFKDYLISRYYNPPLYLLYGNISNNLKNLKIDALSVISIKVVNGKEEILFEKNADRILPIASLTKLMTAFVIFEYPKQYDLSQTITISDNVLEINGDYGFEEKEFLRKDLLSAMLIESNNDAAYALAQNVPFEEDGLKNFIKLMNNKAEELNLKKTFFTSSTGLSEDYSTAREIAELSKVILYKHPDILKVSIEPSFNISDVSNEFNYLAVNKNELLNKLPNIVGGKTGWTKISGGCLVLIQKNEKEEYFINVILGTDSQELRFKEMEKLSQSTYDN